MVSDRLVDKVSETTRGRRDNYGRPLTNFVRIAMLWSTYLEQGISVLDVAMMMDLLKSARIMHSVSEDSILDKMGYMDCVDDMMRNLAELGYSQEAISDRSLIKLIEISGTIRHQVTEPVARSDRDKSFWERKEESDSATVRNAFD